MSKLFETEAVEYLTTSGRHLIDLVTYEEVAKAGVIAMLTAGDADPETGYNPKQGEMAKKVFGWPDCRRNQLGKDLILAHERAEYGAYISWIVTGSMFLEWIKDKTQKELGL